MRFLSESEIRIRQQATDRMPQQKRIWASGFNAFHQLSDQQDGDIWDFQPFEIGSVSNQAPEDDIGFLYSTWSSTAIVYGSRLYSKGFQSFVADVPALAVGEATLCSPFGDHNGLIGCLDSEGRVYFLTDSPEADKKSAPLVCSHDQDSPLLSHLALAGNGRVAVSFKQAPNASLTHIVEFADLTSFANWHEDPSNAAYYPAAHHMLPGRPKQLLANAANFVLLMESGEVYTWGDPRFRTLARSTVGPEAAAAADKPGLVEALGGLNIVSVQCGPGVGWLASALSEDGALYLWGTTTPGEDGGTMRCLQEAGAGEVALVDILPSPESEPADIISAAIGRNHIAVVTDVGQVFVVGDNNNGQLGIGKERPFAGEWTQVPYLHGISRVVAGPKATFAFEG